jgi:hypothetical protein
MVISRLRHGSSSSTRLDIGVDEELELLVGLDAGAEASVED